MLVYSMLGVWCWVGIENVVNAMRVWMTNNTRRNPTRQIKLNMTGHMSEIIIKSMPYCIVEASKIVNIHHAQIVKDYIEKFVVGENDVVTHLSVAIDWDDDNNNNSNSVNSNNIDSNSNDNNNENSVNSNNNHRVEARENQNDNDSDDVDIHLNVNIDFNIEENNDDFNNDYNIIDEAKDVVENVSSNVENINNAAFEEIKSQHEHEPIPQMTKINYRYTYKINNTDTVYHFNNDDNVAGVDYSQMLNLAVLYDYCSLWRKVFCVFCTLRWPKNAKNETPRDILNSHVWARSAVYKAKIFGDWLLHPYAKWAGGVGTYMLEAFWHYNPHGYGFYIVNQQMCEHWGKWMKDNRRSCGSANGNNFLYELADNYDIFVIGRILNDLIDFKQVVKKEVLQSARKFDLATVSQLEDNILIGAPKFFRMLRARLGQMMVGDPMPPVLQNLKAQDSHPYSRLGDHVRSQLRRILRQRKQNQQQAQAQAQAQQQHQQQQQQHQHQHQHHQHQQQQQQQEQEQLSNDTFEDRLNNIENIGKRIADNYA